MKLIVFLLFLLVPLCLGLEDHSVRRSSREQGHIQYDDPNGHKVSWRLYSPYTQWKSHLENSQPTESKTEEVETVAEAKSDKSHESTVPVIEKQQQYQTEKSVEYKPYSMVPTHIKQLIFRMYEPQGPYIDPKVYIYHTPQTEIDQSRSELIENKSETDKHQESASTQEEAIEQPQQKYTTYQDEYEIKTENHQQVQERTSDPSTYQQSTAQDDDSNKYQQNEYSGYQNPLLVKKKIKYDKYPSKDIKYVEYKKEEETKPEQYGFISHQESEPQSSIKSELSASEPLQQTQEEHMISSIQQLLDLQAQIPYHVIANRISYKPKKMFIPKPIFEDAKGAYTYRSKVYYMTDDIEDQENKSDDKIVKDQRH